MIAQNEKKQEKERVRVGYLGPKGTFTYEAALKYFEDVTQSKRIRAINDDTQVSAEYVAIDTISQVFRELESGNLEYGVVPIENKLKGLVAETFKELVGAGKDQEKDGIKVIGMIKIEIRQALMSIHKLEDIEVVYSHEMAIKQSMKYIKERLGKHVKIIQVESTGKGAELAASKGQTNEQTFTDDSMGSGNNDSVDESNNPHTIKAACIGNKTCSQLYKMNIIDPDISDEKENETKFYILSGIAGAKDGMDMIDILKIEGEAEGGEDDNMCDFDSGFEGDYDVKKSVNSKIRHMLGNVEIIKVYSLEGHQELGKLIKENNSCNSKTDSYEKKDVNREYIVEVMKLASSNNNGDISTNGTRLEHTNSDGEFKLEGNKKRKLETKIESVKGKNYKIETLGGYNVIDGIEQ
ncbi:P-protein [Zancudomyces culisetae]|uniref:p-protein n=1 Tax=Zancudomyces culisetae TaxID=1213189 RepID=A0A1R1PDJ4_ZANCU|nr:P-protein [Zancudomyces culisetae]|eukprot:OMH78942.1 P-protein [Zancudomyces culisetae]